MRTVPYKKCSLWELYLMRNVTYKKWNLWEMKLWETYYEKWIYENWNYDKCNWAVFYAFHFLHTGRDRHQSAWRLCNKTKSLNCTSVHCKSLQYSFNEMFHFLVLNKLQAVKNMATLCKGRFVKEFFNWFFYTNV